MTGVFCILYGLLRELVMLSLFNKTKCNLLPISALSYSSLNVMEPHWLLYVHTAQACNSIWTHHTISQQPGEFKTSGLTPGEGIVNHKLQAKYEMEYKIFKNLWRGSWLNKISFMKSTKHVQWVKSEITEMQHFSIYIKKRRVLDNKISKTNKTLTQCHTS